MEHEKFYSKQALAFEIGISLKTLGQRIKNNEDEALRNLYKVKRLLSPAERLYILQKLLYQFESGPEKWDGCYFRFMPCYQMDHES